MHPPTVLARGGLGALEYELVAQVGAEKQANGPLAPLTIITGSHLQHIYLRRLLARARGSLLNIRFLTVLDAAVSVDAVAQAAGGRASAERGPAPSLPDAIHPLLVEWLLAQEVAADEGPATVAHMPIALTASLRAMREGGVPPHAPAAISGRRWLRQLAALAHRYQAQLRQFDDRTAAFEQVSDAPPTALDAALPAGPVIVYGIYDANALQLRLLVRIAEVRSVCLFLLWRREQDALGFAGGMLERLRSCGFRVDDAPDKQDTEQHGRGQRRRIMSVTDRHAEVEEVVRRVWEQVSAGVPAAEIAIVHRLDQSFDDTVSAALRRAGLPFYRAGGSPVRRTSLGRAALGLLHLLYGEARRATLLELLSLPCVSLRWIDQRLRSRPVRWEALTKEAGMVKGWQEFRHVLSLQIGVVAAGDEEPEWVAARREEAEALLQVVEAFATESEHAGERTSWAEHVAAFLDLLQRVAPAEQDTEAFRVVADRIGSLRALDAVPSVASLGSFQRAAELLIRQAIISGGYFQRDGVFVGNVSAMRFVRFERVYLLECSERTFPALVREDPLLQDRERAAINRQFGGDFTYLPLKRDRLDEERLLFELVCQAARGQLTLSFPRQSIRSGTVRLPSSFVLDAAQLLAGSFLSADALSASHAEWFERVPSAVSFAAAAEGAESALRALDDSDLRLHVLEHGGTQAVTAIEPLWAGIDRVRAFRAARRRGSYGAYDGMVPAELVSASGILGSDLSPSGAADYVTCPYRFFLSRVLGVRALPEPEETLEIAAVDRGNLVHRVLERLVAGFLDAGGDWATHLADAEGQIDPLIEGELARLPDGIRGLPVSWERIREQVVEDLRSYLAGQLVQATGDDQLQPVAVERTFAAVPISLGEQSEGASLSIAGRVDRVDRTGRGLRIVDYKTGSAARQRADDYRVGKSFQLPFYLLATSATEQRALATCVAELHFVSSRGNFTVLRLDGADLHTDARLLEQLATIRAGIESGSFFYRPGTARANCKFCDFTHVCHGSVDRHEQRKRPGSREVVERHEVLVSDRPHR